MPRRPNIVLILADDMGYGDLGCLHPASKIPTPNLDRLAAEGVRLTDAHAPSAVCTPTRYALMTGRYCWRSRLTKGVLNGFSEHLLEEGRPTVASMLRWAGYHTACVGKWHLGWDWARGSSASADDPSLGFDLGQPIGHGPTTAGFDDFYGIPASLDMPPYCYVNGDRVTAVPDGVVAASAWDAFWREGAIAEDFRHADVLPHLTEKAIAYIHGRARDGASPFFLYFALPAPHTPILPLEPFRGRSGAGDYGDFCVQVDDVVGQVMRALQETETAEDTLLLFTSDNGPERNAYDRILRYGHYSMGPLRGVKRDLWEGGHRVPLLARWPGHIAPNSTSPETVSLVDFFATAAEAAGLDLPADAAEDSLSLLPALLGQPVDRRRREAIVYHGAAGRRALRRGDWVLVDAPTGDGNREPEWFKQERGYVPHDHPGELFHLGDDPAEARNLYAERPDVVAELCALMARYVAEGRSVRR
jgi:arylsulfatase A